MIDQDKIPYLWTLYVSWCTKNYIFIAWPPTQEKWQKFMFLGANIVSLGYWLILAELMINIGEIKNMAIN